MFHLEFGGIFRELNLLWTNGNIIWSLIALCLCGIVDVPAFAMGRGRLLRAVNLYRPSLLHISFEEEIKTISIVILSLVGVIQDRRKRVGQSTGLTHYFTDKTSRL